MTSITSKFASWYTNAAAFKVEDLFSQKRKAGPRRTVFVNENIADNYRDHRGRVKPEHVYSTNQVITSKYTIITFVPRNLLEQFRRIANIFFLGIAILQFFPIFSTISPGLVIFPLLVVVSITAVKDAYEDVKRHQSDYRVNHRSVRVLSGGNWVNPNVMQRKSKTFVPGALRTYGRRVKIFKRAEPKEEALVGVTVPEYDDDIVQEEGYLPDHTIREVDNRPHWRQKAWEDTAVGDFVKVLDNESIPADLLICSTSEDENVAYVETKNLDGETNLKSRNAVPALTHLRTAADCANSHNAFRIDCERPEVNMYRLNAALKVGKETFPVDMQMAMLRGSVLRNTKWIIGIVIYTGEDTRIVMNSGGTPSKRSKVERQMNPQVFINLMLLALMATACGVIDSVLEHRYYPESAPWLFADNTPSNNPSINGLITFCFALITFQNIVPISLYISIEFVRTCQAAFIYYDTAMVYKGQSTVARSWNLSDDLGQVEYIFSDKTGTLTQNSMVFKKCSIGGKMYNGDEVSEEEEKGSMSKDFPPAYVKDITSAKEQDLGTDIPLESITLSPTLLSPTSTSGDPQKPSDAKKVTTDSSKSDDNRPSSSESTVTTHFHDAELTRDIFSAVHADQDSTDADHARHLNGFFSVLALCHTVLTNVDKETGKIEYKAQSPDEAALVQAAADMGFVFKGREREVLVLQTPFGGTNVGGPEDGDEIIDRETGYPSSATDGEGSLERYELLNILEFTSVRKRMSVVLRKLDGDDSRLFLLSKGADSVIFERLKPGAGEELKQVTEKHLDEFASQGLRTLTLAYKVIKEDEYNAWSERYQEAMAAMDDREAKVDALSDELEQDLRLLGATAIEDRLQDGVPEAIADLKRAGIKIWVATGDRLETAIAIGHSTNLIGQDSNIIVVRGGKSGKPVYQQILNAIEEFFPDSDILDENGEPKDVVRPQLAEGSSQQPFSSPMSFQQQQSMNQQPNNPAGGPLRRTLTGISDLVGPNNGDRPGGFVLVIDGAALDVALSDKRHKDLLLHLAMLCEGVICCRVSPLQKALVVKLVKDGLHTMTLAIGDGANDVSMIQAADVGVGISGEEGLQAVNASDYAIAQFRFLKRLLLVHGHWSYARNGNMILNFFYKNIVCIGVLWWFQIYCAWSSTYAFEYTYLIFWNSFWTIAPVIAIGLFDRFVDDHVLMNVPELYWFGREGKWFGMRSFIVYMFDGVYQAAIIFFLIAYTYFSTTARDDGWAISLYEFSTTMVFASVFATNFFNGLNTSAWTGWVFFAVFLGDVLLLVYTAVYNAIPPSSFSTFVWGNNNFLFKSAFFWLSLPLAVLLALLPRYIFKAWKLGYRPDDVDILRYISKMEPNRDLTRDPQTCNPLTVLRRRPTSIYGRTDSLPSLSQPMNECRSGSRTDMSTGQRSIHRGFNFSTEENGVAIRRMQTNLSERRQSSRNLAEVPETEMPPRRRDTISHVFAAPRNFLRRKA